MKPYQNYLNRIDLMQAWLKANPNAHVNKMLEELHWINRGTISCNLSQMKQAGHVILTAKGFYQLPENPASPEKVARDIAEMLRSNRKKVNGTRTALKNFQIEIDDYSAETSAAIELLKTRGYKVLAPVTEFKEI